MRSLGSFCANGRFMPMHPSDPMKRVSLVRGKRRPIPVKVVTRVSRKDRAGYIVIAAKDNGGPCVARSATALRCRKPMVFLAMREREGTVAQHRKRCRLTIHCAPRDEKHLRGVRRARTGESVAPMARTEPCDTPRFSIPRAHWREPATAREQPALRAPRTRRNDALPENATSRCDSPICAGSPSIAYRDSGSVANRMRSSAPEFRERRRRPAQWQDPVRSASIRDRAVAREIRASIRRTTPLVEKCHFRQSRNPRSRGADAISFWLPTTECAAGRKLVQAPRAKPRGSKRVARSRDRRPAPYGRQEHSAPCERRFRLRPTHRRLGRIPFEDWRSDSVAQVRRLPGSFLKTLLGIRAAAGCCSWNLPGLVRSRLGEKRNRKVEFEVRGSMVPTSRYLRKVQKNAVNMRASAHCTPEVTLGRATPQNGGWQARHIALPNPVLAL